MALKLRCGCPLPQYAAYARGKHPCMFQETTRQLRVSCGPRRSRGRGSGHRQQGYDEGGGDDVIRGGLVEKLHWVVA